MPADDQARDSTPRWYHWAALSVCTVVMLGMGLLEVLDGADPASRFFAIDSVVVRILGVALVLCALWLPVRHDRAFVVSMWLLGATIVENLATYRFETSSLFNTGDLLVSIVLMFVVPILILAELRPVFTSQDQRPRE